MYQANLSEISRKAASALIERLNEMLQEQWSAVTSIQE
jgi:hypothetical protein